MPFSSCGTIKSIDIVYLQFMLYKQERFDMRNPPPWMLSYIRHRVGQRAAMVEAQTTYQSELSKSQRLVEIEDRYRADKTDKLQKIRLEKMSQPNLWIF